MNDAHNTERWMIYHDNARMLVDAAPDPNDGGPIGSNWQPGRSRAEAEAFVEECLSLGYTRGHQTQPRF